MSSKKTNVYLGAMWQLLEIIVTPNINAVPLICPTKGYIVVINHFFSKCRLPFQHVHLTCSNLCKSVSTPCRLGFLLEERLSKWIGLHSHPHVTAPGTLCNPGSAPQHSSLSPHEPGTLQLKPVNYPVTLDMHSCDNSATPCPLWKFFYCL